MEGEMGEGRGPANRLRFRNLCFHSSPVGQAMPDAHLPISEPRLFGLFCPANRAGKSQIRIKAT